MEKFIQLGEKFGLEGEKLLEFVREQAEKEREEKRRSQETGVREKDPKSLKRERREGDQKDPKKVQEPVSRKSRKFFGHEKQFAKLRSAYS